jgi:hypothetical protein
MLATICALYAFMLLLYTAISPVLTTQMSINNQLVPFAGVSIGLSRASNIAPFTIALTIIPMCIALAYDKLTS